MVDRWLADHVGVLRLTTNDQLPPANAYMIKVNLIGKANGVGLSRDLELVADALRAVDCEVTITPIDVSQARRRRSQPAQWMARARAVWQGSVVRAKPPTRFDVNVMLEHLWPQFLHWAKHNVAIPNPEWFDRHDRRFLGTVDRVWAKTEYTSRIFAKLGSVTSQIGFDSLDRYDAKVRRNREFFHLAGKSSLKGTERLLQAWLRRPDWPTLTVVQHARNGLFMPTAKNLRYCVGYMEDGNLRTLQNANRYHVCLSETEGWGHYIAEALSVGAITISVDAPPMNELVSAERGFLVPYSATASQRLAEKFLFDARVLEQVIDAAIALPDAELERKGDLARTWFLRNKGGFATRLQQAMHELLDS